MPNAQNVLLRYNMSHSSKSGQTASGTAGRLTRINGKTLIRHHTNSIWEYCLRDQTGNVHGRVPEDIIITTLTRLEAGYINTYSNVKNHPGWQTAYMRAPRPVNLVNAAGNLTQSQNVWTYPCHYCGIVLPEQLIEVDHRQPKSRPGPAILKSLHTLHNQYAGSGAHGRKATQLDNIMQNGNIQPITPKGWSWGNWQSGLATRVNALATANDPLAHINAQAKQDRYRITEYGETFLSVCVMYYGQSRTEKICVNNLINLVPACGICNGASGKGASAHAHQ
ncbi:hypothetical protein JQX13_33365 [Archangium violaceum]|uniref:hypothetical protein n=1 Tax=Archangium violaceum TaxID=83451 RepID=UPI00193B3633|nr:hypothetical protein [Archangium violaceum]QRK05072.1 hypothetical protein JQX13_33365 [Archangium violaceum]